MFGSVFSGWCFLGISLSFSFSGLQLRLVWAVGAESAAGVEENMFYISRICGNFFCDWLIKCLIWEKSELWLNFIII